jgi:hypothetical protein
MRTLAAFAGAVTVPPSSRQVVFRLPAPPDAAFCWLMYAPPSS